MEGDGERAVGPSGQSARRGRGRARVGRPGAAAHPMPTPFSLQILPPARQRSCRANPVAAFHPRGMSSASSCRSLVDLLTTSRLRQRPRRPSIGNRPSNTRPLVASFPRRHLLSPSAMPSVPSVVIALSFRTSSSRDLRTDLAYDLLTHRSPHYAGRLCAAHLKHLTAIAPSGPSCPRLRLVG
jgi:hypothetical protein